MKINYVPKVLEVLVTDSAVTRKVKLDYNTLTDTEFLYKYSCTKLRYYKRVLKYGDPYMYAPLAIMGKWLNKHL